MSSEYRVVSRPTPGPSLCRKSPGTRRGECEKSPILKGYKNSPLIRGDRGGCKSPLLRGDRLRSVQRSNQGCVDGALISAGDHSKDLAPAEHTPRSANQASPFCLHRSPLKRGFTVAVALLVAIFMGSLTTSLHAQGFESSTNSVNTPPADRKALPGYSPQGEIVYPQLEEYIRIAMEENPELRSLHHLYEAEKERAREVGVLPDPELGINYDFNPMMSESQLGRFSVSAMQMFPWFGTLGARKEAQKYSAEARRTMIDSRQLEVLRDIQITWFDIAEVEQQMRIANETLKLVGDLEQLVEIRYETARTGQADILRIQMEKQRIQNRIENLEDKIRPLKAKFNEYLNREPNKEVVTARLQQQHELPYTAGEITKLARDQNPVFETLRFQESALKQQERAAVMSGRPSFGIGFEVMGRDFGPMSMFADSKESFIGMATIRLPIYRNRTQSQKQQISNRLQAVDMERYQTENRISSDLESAQETLRSSNRSIDLLDDELIPRARQVLDILSEEYTAGNARFDELLQIQRELLDLEFERVEAVVGQNKAVVRIESLIGRTGQ